MERNWLPAKYLKWKRPDASVLKMSYGNGDLAHYFERFFSYETYLLCAFPGLHEQEQLIKLDPLVAAGARSGSILLWSTMLQEV
jgi:hypothetical protein